METEDKYDNLEIISVNIQPAISQFFNFTKDISISYLFLLNYILSSVFGSLFLNFDCTSEVY